VLQGQLLSGRIHWGEDGSDKHMKPGGGGVIGGGVKLEQPVKIIRAQQAGAVGADEVIPACLLLRPGYAQRTLPLPPPIGKEISLVLVLGQRKQGRHQVAAQRPHTGGFLTGRVDQVDRRWDERIMRRQACAEQPRRRWYACGSARAGERPVNQRIQQFGVVV